MFGGEQKLGFAGVTFDRVVRTKPLAFAADAAIYGI
jgi:hypothetical protein